MSDTAQSALPTDFPTLDQLTPGALARLLDRAAACKAGTEPARLDGRTVALLFQKPSTRTRTSLEAGLAELGAHPTFLGPEEAHLGHGEPVKDTARALSGYVDAVVARLNDHEDLTELAAYAEVPVVNALTDRAHPCQTLADLLTLRELAPDWTVGERSGAPTLAWVGDGNNVARSLVVGCALAGVNLRLATPPGYGVDDDALALARDLGRAPTLFDDPAAAVDGADAVYTDVWVSMGEEAARAEKLPAFAGYQVNEALLAGTDAELMHCLPAHRGEEVTDAVLEGERSVVWQQAANRKPTAQALLLELLGE